MSDEQCCIVSCENQLDQNYWDAQYKSNSIAWDLGQVSPPMKEYIDALENKNASILIPGCGNTYEAQYLLEQGFTNITVIDIAPTLIQNLQKKFINNKNIKVVLGDFFEHQGVYDLVLEQTFFCALPPTMRQKYVWKMHQLLTDNGILSGLLFNITFDISPPFGGNEQEYKQLFLSAFHIQNMEISKKSVSKRLNSELFFEFKKNSENVVNLFQLVGITCAGCKNTVSDKFLQIDEVHNVSMSSDFAEVLIVSSNEIPLEMLQKEISYDEKYKIEKIL